MPGSSSRRRRCRATRFLIAADNTTITFTPGADGGPTMVIDLMGLGVRLLNAEQVSGDD